MKLADAALGFARRLPVTDIVRLSGVGLIAVALALDVATKWELTDTWALLLGGLVVSSAANHIGKRWTTKPELGAGEPAP